MSLDSDVPRSTQLLMDTESRSSIDTGKAKWIKKKGLSTAFHMLTLITAGKYLPSQQPFGAIGLTFLALIIALHCGSDTIL